MTLRCSNCGFDNQDNAQTCLKCSTRLTPDNLVSDTPKTKKVNFGGTIPGRQTEGMNESPVPGDHLKRSEEIFGAVAGDEVLSAATITCPSPDCGFVNLGNRTTCIKCHRPLHRDMAATARDRQYKYGYRPIVVETKPVQSTGKEETGGEAPFSGTIDPYRMGKSEGKSCFLGIMPTAREEEELRSEARRPDRHYTGLLTNRKFDCNEGDKISLNRENLDPSNNTITSQTQAELSFEDGKWYLEDKSEHRTTFILAAGKTELKDGDIILMGDRRIIFRENDDWYQEIIQRT